MASLSGGLLRLMMAGLIYRLLPQMGFWISFFISETALRLSSITVEDLSMVKRSIKRLRYAIVVSLKATRPYRHSLLMSL